MSHTLNYNGALIILLGSDGHAQGAAWVSELWNDICRLPERSTQAGHTWLDQGNLSLVRRRALGQDDLDVSHICDGNLILFLLLT